MRKIDALAICCELLRLRFCAPQKPLRPEDGTYKSSDGGLMIDERLSKRRHLSPIS